jgi:hypothetical protein
MSQTLSQMAVEVLTTADGRAKTALGRKHAATWFAARAAGQPLAIGHAQPPLQPARPEKPDLLSPRDVPRRRPTSALGRIAMLHAIAHIELNAVDLHWDIIARFAHVPMPLGYFDDWVKAADDEAKHFNLLCDCLESLGSSYGAMPAHAGMWRAAEDTAEDFMGRLAVVPMVLEARFDRVTLGERRELLGVQGRAVVDERSVLRQGFLRGRTATAGGAFELVVAPRGQGRSLRLTAEDGVGAAILGIGARGLPGQTRPFAHLLRL